MIASLVICGSAIYNLAEKVGGSFLSKISGFVAAIIGLFVFFWGPTLLPWSPTRFAEPLAFGVAYGGQALIVFRLSLLDISRSGDEN